MSLDYFAFHSTDIDDQSLLPDGNGWYVGGFASATADELGAVDPYTIIGPFSSEANANDYLLICAHP